MKKQWIIITAVLALMTAGAVLGVRLAPDIFPVEVGSRAPAFRAVDLASGDSTGLDRYKGQVVLLNIWATWCEPCRVEMPALERLHQALAGDGLKIVAVSIDEADPSVVREFQRQYGLTFDMLQDRTRAIERIYQTTGVPETFVLNRDGDIVKKVIGAHAWDSAADEDLIRRLIAQRQ
jgi:cytochrome c biogenesis protein CcmG/thiol:disulfide interchange protein DsbE